LIPLVPCPAQRYALAEAALHDGSAGRVDGFDPPDRAPRDGNAGQPGKDEYQRDAQKQGHLDLARERVEIAGVSSDQQMIAVGKRVERRA